MVPQAVSLTGSFFSLGISSRVGYSLYGAVSWPWQESLLNCYFLFFGFLSFCVRILTVQDQQIYSTNTVHPCVVDESGIPRKCYSSGIVQNDSLVCVCDIGCAKESIWHSSVLQQDLWLPDMLGLLCTFRIPALCTQSKFVLLCSLDQNGRPIPDMMNVSLNDKTCMLVSGT